MSFPFKPSVFTFGFVKLKIYSQSKSKNMAKKKGPNAITKAGQKFKSQGAAGRARIAARFNGVRKG